jgi:hypothetical protein
MANNPKGNNLLIPLIVFVVLFVACGVTAFLFYQETTKLKTQVASETDKAKKATADKTKSDEQTRILKGKIGYPDLDFGQENDAAGGETLMAKVAEELSKYSPGAGASLTFKEELARLNQQVQDNKKLVDNLNADLAQKAKDFDEKRAVEAQTVAQHDKNAKDANDTLAKEQTEMKQKLDESTRQVTEYAKQATDSQELQKQKEREYEVLKNKTDREISEFSVATTDMKNKLTKIESVGKQVGEVVSVDNLAKEVYINRGSDDRLTLQTTFSVWSPSMIGTIHWREKNDKVEADAKKEFELSNKQNPLETRLEGGPKGYIEVVAVLGPNQSVGRMTMFKIADPIAPGDLLFSPIWTPGQGKRFALVGRFDLTGTGTNDRKLLVDMIKRQGGTIDAEVDDEGKLIGKIQIGTNWLVTGSVPDPTDSADPDKDKAAPIGEKLAELQAEARRLGVEVIDQKKLYDFMGYTPHTRQYEPGAYTGGPEAKNRFENPTNTTRPSGLPPFDNPGSAGRPPGMGKQYKPR